MDKLTEDQRRVLEYAPFVGFPLGSNMWPLVWLDPDDADKETVDGEIIDGLLRSGLLSASPLKEPVLTDRSPNQEICPDCECSHRVDITEAGRRALSAQGEESNG